MDQESGVTWPETPSYGNGSCGRAIVSFLPQLLF